MHPPVAALAPGERRKAWLGATRRRNEIIRLGLHRAKAGADIQHAEFVFVIAQALGSAPPARFRVRHRYVTWHGLDRVSLAKAVADAGLGQVGCDDDLIERALGQVISTTMMGADEAGRLLQLTAEERDLLAIRTMEAIDERRIDREARRRLERQIRDAERKRRSRSGVLEPRAVYLANSLSATKPWIALGISRRTYERRRAVAGLSAPDNAPVASLSVSQVCPRTHIIKGSVDTLATSVAEPASETRLQRAGPSSRSAVGAAGASRQ